MLVAADHELLPEDALHLLPGRVPGAGPIGRAGGLGDDSFEAVAAGLLEERGAATDDVVDVAERGGRRVAQQVPESRLSLFDGPPGQVFAVEVEEIEDEVDDRRALVHSVHRGAAVRPDGGDLSVQQGACRPQPRRARGDGRELRRPVLRAPRKHGRPAVLDGGPDPEAVELDLVKPPVTLGRGFREQGQLWIVGRQGPSRRHRSMSLYA